MKRSLLMSCLLLTAAPAMALDGATLLAWCSRAVETTPGRDLVTYESGYCMGWTEGIMALDSHGTAPSFCAPEPTSKTMMMRALIRYLETHPDQLNQPAETLALNALGDAFPCK